MFTNRIILNCKTILTTVKYKHVFLDNYIYASNEHYITQ